MTRLHYWIIAKTQYNIHSPFVFDLYREVLFARLPRAARRGSKYEQLCYKLAAHYGLATLSHDGHHALLHGDAIGGTVLVLNRPHRSRTAEAEFDTLRNDATYRVSIDLYDTALLFTNPRLHPQHFILR